MLIKCGNNCSLKGYVLVVPGLLKLGIGSVFLGEPFSEVYFCGFRIVDGGFRAAAVPDKLGIRTAYHTECCNSVPVRLCHHVLNHCKIGFKRSADCRFREE